MSFLEMSLMGGAMILCILILRMFSRGRLPAIIVSAMWAAALLRLLLPVEIPSALSIAGLIKQISQPAVMTLPNRLVPNTEPMMPLVFIWLCGAVLCALFFLLAGIRQRRVLNTALPAPMTPELISALHDQRLPRHIAVYTSDRISTPLTYGMIKHRIVLPSSMAISGQELNYVIAHEGGHILRRDALKKCVLLFAVCVHWFNPLVWLMAAVCRRDMELNCDRRVLKAYGPEARARYARTLLGLEERRRFSGILMDCLSVSPLEERIRTIMAGKKSSIAGILAAIAVFGCSAAMFATSPGTLPSVTASSIWITTVPLASYDTRQLNTSEAAVYIMRGQTGLQFAAPYITVSSQISRITLADTAAAFLVNDSGTVSVVAGNAADPAVLPVYSMTYTIKDRYIQH
jgi:beta-lactamase regulating signal transducer with metallopeptidase domain